MAKVEECENFDFTLTSLNRPKMMYVWSSYDVLEALIQGQMLFIVIALCTSNVSKCGSYYSCALLFATTDTIIA